MFEAGLLEVRRVWWAVRGSIRRSRRKYGEIAKDIFRGGPILNSFE